MKEDQYRSRILESVHAGVADLCQLGLVDKATMREFGRSESGNTPASAALKLLSLVKAKGLDAIR